VSRVTDRELLIRIDERTRNTENKVEGLAKTVMTMQQEERFCSVHHQRIGALEEDLRLRSRREWGLFSAMMLMLCKIAYDLFR
jgi:gamma-glutamyl-gamma-aminobutyrate hydrolase PuuD